MDVWFPGESATDVRVAVRDAGAPAVIAGVTDGTVVASGAAAFEAQPPITSESDVAATSPTVTRHHLADAFPFDLWMLVRTGLSDCTRPAPSP